MTLCSWSTEPRRPADMWWGRCLRQLSIPHKHISLPAARDYGKLKKSALSSGERRAKQWREGTLITSSHRTDSLPLPLSSLRSLMKRIKRRVSATGNLSCSRFLNSFEALDQVYKFFCQIREFFVGFGNDADFSSRKRSHEIELLNFSPFLDGIG